MESTAIALVAFVVLITGVSKSAFAGALGVFAVPLLMLKFNAIDAITLMLPLLIVADGMSVKSFWKKWDTALLRSLIPGAVVGIVVANLAIDLINPEYLRFAVAVVCIVFAIKSLWFKKTSLSFLNHRLGAYAMSGISGLSSTLVHAGGPPIIMYFSAIGLPRTQFVATAAAFFAIMNLGKLIGALSLGLLSLNVVLTALAFVPVAFLGNWLGVRINGRLNKALFLKVMNCLLLLLGLWLLIQ